MNKNLKIKSQGGGREVVEVSGRYVEEKEFGDVMIGIHGEDGSFHSVLIEERVDILNIIRELKRGLKPRTTGFSNRGKSY